MRSLTMSRLVHFLTALALAAALIGTAPLAAQIQEPTFVAPTVVPQAGGWTSGFHSPA